MMSIWSEKEPYPIKIKDIVLHSFATDASNIQITGYPRMIISLSDCHSDKKETGGFDKLPLWKSNPH